MPIMPYIAIPGIMFLRDIIVSSIESSFITTHTCLTTIEPLIQSYTNILLNNTIRSGSEVVVDYLFHRQRLTLEDDPSYRRRPVVRHPDTGALLHSLAFE